MVLEPDVGSDHNIMDSLLTSLDLVHVADPVQLTPSQWTWGADLDQAIMSAVAKMLHTNAAGQLLLISGLNLAAEGGTALIPAHTGSWVNPLIALARELGKVDWVAVTRYALSEDEPWDKFHPAWTVLGLMRSQARAKEVHHTPEFSFWLIQLQ